MCVIEIFRQKNLACGTMQKIQRCLSMLQKRFISAENQKERIAFQKLEKNAWC